MHVEFCWIVVICAYLNVISDDKIIHGSTVLGLFNVVYMDTLNDCQNTTL